MLILLTGDPGIGKSTALLRLVNLLRERGVDVGGIIAVEVRDTGSRTGFEFLDVATGSRVRLASTSSVDGPRIGRYTIDLDGCRAAAQMLLRAMHSMIIVFDEIGPMELLSDDILNALRSLLELSTSSNSAVIAVVHKRSKHWLIEMYRERASMLIEVHRANRDSIPAMLLDALGIIIRKTR